MGGTITFESLQPNTNDNEFNLLAKLLIATLQGGGSGPTAPATFIGNIVGMVQDFAGADAPSGWLLCYGQAVSRSTYSALFAKIGTTYGAGDGSTTFNLPDCRGRVAAGKDNMGGTSANRLTAPVNGDTLGAAGGSETVEFTVTPSDGDGTFASSTNTVTIVQPTIIFNKIIFTGVA
jgi:microcystin-dependent protein